MRGSTAARRAARVQAHRERHLVACERPRHIELRDGLPMSNLGKVLCRELRKAAVRLRDAGRHGGPSP